MLGIFSAEITFPAISTACFIWSNRFLNLNSLGFTTESGVHLRISSISPNINLGTPNIYHPGFCCESFAGLYNVFFLKTNLKEILYIILPQLMPLRISPSNFGWDSGFGILSSDSWQRPSRTLRRPILRNFFFESPAFQIPRGFQMNTAPGSLTWFTWEWINPWKRRFSPNLEKHIMASGSMR